jgi:hypothetical protein
VLAHIDMNHLHRSRRASEVVFTTVVRASTPADLMLASDRCSKGRFVARAVLRMLRNLLMDEGFSIGRLQVSTLMKRMGIEALHRKPNASKPAPGHQIYPYLLRKLPMTRPNTNRAICRNRAGGPIWAPLCLSRQASRPVRTRRRFHTLSQVCPAR